MDAITQFFRDESGQGINEYAAILAFVSVVFVLIFQLTSGSFSTVVIGCYNNMSGQIFRLITLANSI